MPIELSSRDARRIALGAQGLSEPRPTTRQGVAHVKRLAAKLQAFQIDSVNVLVRAHYMPAFSRLGAYPRSAIEDLAYQRRELFEYWGHAACYLPVALYPLMRWRMEQRAGNAWVRGSKAKRFFDAVLGEVSERGPLSASEVTNGGKARGSWWGWSDGKMALEGLLASGRLAVAGRRNFERLYDVPERVIPDAVRNAAAPDKDDARKQLLVLASKALGIGTARDIAMYFHVDQWWDRARSDGRPIRSELPRLFRELVDEQRIVPVRVEGWKDAAFLHPGAKPAKTLEARALVSPFDPLLWERGRISRLFGFEYQIEIYVPAPKRQYGYYCLPFLLGEHLVARVDLKADRKTSTLLVPGAFPERGIDMKVTAEALAAELRRMSDWLGLDGIRVASKGGLASPLRRVLRSR